MCGLPPEITYDEYVQVAVNSSLIRWLRIDDELTIAAYLSGATPPLDYYRAIYGTENAERVRDDHMLTAAMNRAGHR